ncbi:MAG TPA: hypothetical protein VD763_13450 [Candidatus Saccharimonadales bacterium]|nr:hypothetical protein [Candidatus Saccharimonadales bacterium]
MAIDETAPRTRRAILAAGVGGVLAAVASTLGRPAPVIAANGDHVVGGQTVTTTSATQVINNGGGTSLAAISGAVPEPVALNSRVGLMGYANQDSNARGVSGRSPQGTGVQGDATSGRGVRGISVSGTGVQAVSTGGKAAHATNQSTSQPTILAQSSGGGTAFQAVSGTGTVPAVLPQTGVYGIANQGESANGVVGRSDTGTGLYGDSAGGYGVIGASDFTGVYGFGSYGVVGDADGGTGVYGWSGTTAPPPGRLNTAIYAAAQGNRTALEVNGVFKASRSGETTIQSGSTRTVTGVPLVPASIVLAMLQNNRSGVWVRAVTTSVADSSFTIHLNTSVSTATIVAWFVVN